MNKYPDFWAVIIGPGHIGAFLGFIVIAYLCAFVSLLWEASDRDLQSPNSPVRFSWAFLFSANLKRIIANLVLVPLMVRWLYPKFSIEAMVLTAMLIGICFDRLFMFLKNKGISFFTNQELASKVNEKVSQNDLTVTDKPNQ